MSVSSWHLLGKFISTHLFDAYCIAVSHNNLLNSSATLGNALIYIYPAIMFRGAVNKLSNPTKMQKRETKFAMGSALLGVVMGTMGAIKAVQNYL